MSLINKETYAVKRTATGSYTDGIFVAGAVTNLTVKGNCQPVSGNEILQISEGDRKRQVIKIYTTEELMLNDIVTVDNKEFEAHPIENWSRQGKLQHYKTFLMLKDT